MSAWEGIPGDVPAQPESAWDGTTQPEADQLRAEVMRLARQNRSLRRIIHEANRKV